METREPYRTPDPTRQLIDEIIDGVTDLQNVARGDIATYAKRVEQSMMTCPQKHVNALMALGRVLKHLDTARMDLREMRAALQPVPHDESRD